MEAIGVAETAGAGRGRLTNLGREPEDDLIEYALAGGGPRSHEGYMGLFTKTAFAAPGRRTIGWGYTFYTLEP